MQNALPDPPRTIERYVPPDAMQAFDEWKATCGPAAMAAACCVPVGSLRPIFQKLHYKGWTTPTMMKQALYDYGRTIVVRGTFKQFLDGVAGVAFLQIQGPWLGPGKPVAAAYKHTHWVASDGAGWVYDLNAADGFSFGAWRPLARWAAEVMAGVVNHHRGATGWHIRQSYEVFG